MTDRGQRLQEALFVRNVKKQLALATALRVHESAITRWKKNKSMSVANVVALCGQLDISADWLLMGRGEIDQHKLTQAEQRAPSIEHLSKKSIDLLNRFIDSIKEPDGEGVPVRPTTTS